MKSDSHLAIAHVLFIDVVGYSTLLVNEQREAVQALNEIVRQTSQFRSGDANGELICIASGDGMALVFFRSPEQPAQCASEISEALKNHPLLRLSGPSDSERIRPAQMVRA